MTINKSISILLFLIIISVIIVEAQDNRVDVKSNQWSGMFTYLKTSDVLSGIDMYDRIAKYDFYIPVDSYVYVKNSGNMLWLDVNNTGRSYSIKMSVDSGDSEKTHNSTKRKYYYPDSYFEINKMYYLKKGYHTAYLFSEVSLSDSIINLSVKVRDITIYIIANQNGRIDIE